MKRQLTHPEKSYILSAFPLLTAAQLASELFVSEQAIYRVVREQRRLLVDCNYYLQGFLISLKDPEEKRLVLKEKIGKEKPAREVTHKQAA